MGFRHYTKQHRNLIKQMWENGAETQEIVQALYPYRSDITERKVKQYCWRQGWRRGEKQEKQLSMPFISKRRRYTPTEKKQIFKMYRQGESLAVICEHIRKTRPNTTESSIAALLSRHKRVKRRTVKQQNRKNGHTSFKESVSSISIKAPGVNIELNEVSDTSIQQIVKFVSENWQ